MPIAPILLLLFNRPDLTQELISILRSVRPSKVYVAIDGPRTDKAEESQKVQEVLQVARTIDWTKEVHFLVREKNLGCGKAVSSAIDWFFEQEEQGIILEDDIHPSVDLLPFCSEMLARYAEDDRIGTISGFSGVPSSLRHPGGYFFSKYAGVWGWATWRRVWKTYNFRLTSSLTEEGWEKIVTDHTEEGLERAYFLHYLKEWFKKENAIDTWDFQHQLCVWRNNQINVVAGCNLVTNRGFGRPDATNTTMDSHFGFTKANLLVGPFPEQVVEADTDMDRRGFMHFFGVSITNPFFAHAFHTIDPTYASLVQQNQALKMQLSRYKNKLRNRIADQIWNLLYSSKRKFGMR